MGVLGHGWKNYFLSWVSKLRGIWRIRGLDKGCAEVGMEGLEEGDIPESRKCVRFL